MIPPRDHGTEWRDTARDWVTIWQSEMAALAEDREALEMWRGAVDGWARMAETMIDAMPDAGLNDRVSGSAAPAGAAPAPAAPDPRDAELARLAERVAELERRLSGVEGR